MNKKMRNKTFCLNETGLSEKGQALPRFRRMIFALFLMAALFSGGCAASAANMPAAAPIGEVALPPPINTVIEPLDAYRSPDDNNLSPLPTPTPTPEGDTPLRVTIVSQIRANIRSGPSTSFEIIGKANPGLTFDVIGQSEDGRWYQIAPNIPGIDGQPLESGWVAAELARVAGEGEVPVVANISTGPLLEPDLAVKWAVHWQCESERCQLKECNAEVSASVNRQPSGGFLPIEHTVVWDDACFSTDAWTFEVNQMTGEERTGEAEQNFLYGYWLGANPGQAIGVFPLNEREGVQVFCSGLHTVEIEEGGGWTTVYQGNTCHDVRTGMLVYLNYIKRWLYTGDYDGKTYNRAFFGDIERLEQRLIEANTPLARVIKK